MKKPLLSCLLLLSSCFIFGQSFFSSAVSPADNGASIAGTVAVTPPGSMLEGDLVVIYAYYRVNAATLSISATGGQAWSTANSGAGGNLTTSVFWTRFNGTWSGNPSVAGGDGVNPLSVNMYVFRPSAATNSWAVHMGPTNGTATNTAITINGITTTAARTVTMGLWASENDNTWALTPATGWSKNSLAGQSRNTGGNDISHTAAYNIQAAAATLTAVTQTQSLSTATRTSIISWMELTPPSNDNFTGARLITTDSACVNGTSRLTGQTLGAATVEGTGLTSCGTTGSPDVWYKFLVRSPFPTVTLSNLGSNWGTSHRIQVFKGTWGSLTEIACGTAASLTVTPSANQLAIGDTAFVRIHKNSATLTGTANWGFDICVTDPLTRGGRMREVFSRTVLSAANVLSYPWEITYGPDDNLWITESRGYKIYRMNPNTGARTTVLDISFGSTFFTAPADVAFNCQYNHTTFTPQGGLAGMALHPYFLNGQANETNHVYVSYIHTRTSSTLYTARLVRFTYNAGTNRLESPVSICDTLPGSNDHNSQRMTIAPMTKGGSDYFLFYACGDMGAGQGSNVPRPIKSQLPESYEGKILRFNLDNNDGDAGRAAWIPNDNPYNGMPGVGAQSAVWNIGQRNNQGFAYDTSTHKLYGASHGPYSDDEINVLEGFRNYGHPLIVGYYADGNYDGDTSVPSTRYSAGAPFNTVGSGYSSNPPISSESSRRTQINASGFGTYREPLFSAYPGPNGTGAGTPRNIWSTTTGSNGSWPSEGWSGLDIYLNKVIPGWKRSLVAGGLKWGRLIRLKLNSDGERTMPSGLTVGNSTDTITYFQSVNRYRDLAFGPNGKDIYLVMDNSSATSGPGTNNPVAPGCPGCVIKYTFLGYGDSGGKSTIDTSIAVAAGTPNAPTAGTPVTIDAANSRLWVPITGPDGNIVAEINAMGQSLGLITTSYYTHSGPIRIKNGFRYLNRNITITPAVTSFSTPVKIRLYITKAEFDALDLDPASGITGIGTLKILKNDDPISAEINSSTQEVPITITGTDLEQSNHGYVLQGQVTSFSSFYFGASNITLPLELVYFKGALQNDATQLKWETINENNTSHFEVERSLDGRSFTGIGAVNAIGSAGTNNYAHTDNAVNTLGSTVLYYRLKMIDKDGKFKYSNVITIYLADVAGKVVVTPNPTSGQAQLAINAEQEGKVEWRIIDNNGRVILRNTVQVRSGYNNYSINAAGLKAGMYFLHVTGAGIDQNLKLQKL